MTIIIIMYDGVWECVCVKCNRQKQRTSQYTCIKSTLISVFRLMCQHKNTQSFVSIRTSTNKLTTTGMKYFLFISRRVFICGIYINKLWHLTAVSCANHHSSYFVCSLNSNTCPYVIEVSNYETLNIKICTKYWSSHK